MKIVLETNRRYGEGYQLHVSMTTKEVRQLAKRGRGTGRIGLLPAERVMDAEPFTIYEAIGRARRVVSTINEWYGMEYQLSEVLAVTEGAVSDNSVRDVVSAKIQQEVCRGERTLVNIP